MKYTRQNSWREFYNPLRGLTMARIVAMEEAADRGQYADLQWFWDHMPRTDATVISAIEKRLAFIDTLDWTVDTDPDADPILAEEQAIVLRHTYNRIENLKEALRHIGMSIFTGLTVLQKLYSYGPFIQRLDYIEPWYWIKDNEHDRLMFNPQASSHLNRGQMVVEKELIIVENRKPLFKAIARNFFSKQLALADWDVALENGANQSIFMIGPEGATTPEKEAEYQAMAEGVTSNMRGYIPHGGDIKALDLAARSQLPFFQRIEYADKQIVLISTGGLLTMLAESGSGTLAGNAHSDTMIGLAQSDSAKITEILQINVDREILRAFFPGEKPSAYFKLSMPKKPETTADIINVVSNISWSGYRVKKAQLEEKLGLELEFIDPSADPENAAQPVLPPGEAPVEGLPPDQEIVEADQVLPPDETPISNAAPRSEKQLRFLHAQYSQAGHYMPGGAGYVAPKAQPPTDKSKNPIHPKIQDKQTPKYSPADLPATRRASEYAETGSNGKRNGVDANGYKIKDATANPNATASGQGAKITKTGSSGNLTGATKDAPKAIPSKGEWLPFPSTSGAYGAGNTSYVHNDEDSLNRLREDDPAAFANLAKAHPIVKKFGA